MQLFQCLMAETRADMSDVTPDASFSHGKDKSAEVGSCKSGRCKARDHDFLSFRGLDLQPVGRSAARRILAARTLGHDAFKTLALGFGEELLSAALALIAKGDQRVARQY